ncbi:MAG: four helix bundle protein [Chloroflexi bacterium]|nr:four helix bundle protein [Chloroflexota bacterium]
MSIERFEDLEVWKLSRQFVNTIYRPTSAAKFSQDYGLARQIQRSSVSVMSNIAEGFERKSKKEFAKFLFTAKGSCGEVRSQLYVALDQSYISQTEFRDNCVMAEKISKSLGGFIKYLQSQDPDSKS